MGAEDEREAWAEVRAFRASTDAASAANLFKETVEATAWSEGDLRRMGELTGAAAYVSARDDRITGIIIGRQLRDEGEILNLAVRKEERRRRAGAMLVKWMLERFQKEGVRRVFLEVRESNQGAIAFYEWLGFRTTGRRKDYYQEPKEAALVMERPLGNSTE
ncbi:MAG TPA: ribosomal protein S18-alanine N-acetyltransferase [Candidatus Eisenbacteria bacterium]|nr:ribosomal protein S18-alanine N-acetyltransferase [Candidatus Eisenbacteria bacterium]